jgi:site-specific recombinase XerD
VAHAKRKRGKTPNGKTQQRAHDPASLGSRVYKDRKLYHGDFRWLGEGRPVLRNPSAAGWPEAGEATSCPETAAEWAKAYDTHYLTKRTEEEEKSTGIYRTIRSATDPFVRARTRQAEATGSASMTAMNHLAAAVGERSDPASVATKELSDYCGKLQDLGYKPSTVGTIISQWRVFFTDQKIKPNPARDLKAPKEEHFDKVAWVEEERERIVRAAAELDVEIPLPFPRVRLVAYLFATGARIQEAAAAQGTDINEATRVARISKQIARKSGKTKAPKSRKPRSVTVLQEWWDHHDSSPEGLLFPDESGAPVHYRKLYGFVREILETANLKKPGEAAHQFRHTYAYLFLVRGGTIYTLSKSLGHGRVSTTQAYYEHYSSEEAAVKGVDQIYFGDGRKFTRRGPRKR